LARSTSAAAAGALRFGGRDFRFGLLHLIFELAFLQSQRRFALAHLRRDAFRAVLVIGAIRLQFPGSISATGCPLVTVSPSFTVRETSRPADLRRHRDVVRGDDALSGRATRAVS
jgi:hypothetical protein